MRKELTIKQDDFWRLINREQFLFLYFNARLQYRIRMYSHFLLKLIQNSNSTIIQLQQIMNVSIYKSIVMIKLSENMLK
jgi:hypothetical protein